MLESPLRPFSASDRGGCCNFSRRRSINLDALIIVVAFVAGCLAAINGFGIGSILVPVTALTFGTKSAVAMVAIPHFCGTALRCWTLRKAIDRSLLSTFGWL